MPEYVRVRSKATGHEFTITKDQLSEAVVEIDKPALGSDLTPAPVKYRTPLGKKSSGRRPAAKKASDDNGQTAESEKEN